MTFFGYLVILYRFAAVLAGVNAIQNDVFLQITIFRSIYIIHRFATNVNTLLRLFYAKFVGSA